RAGTRRRQGTTYRSLAEDGGRFFFQAEDGIRDLIVTGVQTCALPIFARAVVFNGTANSYEYDGAGNRMSASRSGVVTRYVLDRKIGRASCRERVWMSVAAGAWTETWRSRRG